MKGLEPSAVLPFLRERLRWGVWTVSNNAPITFTSLAPGAVEVDVCATWLSLPAGGFRGKGGTEERGGSGAFPDVGETVWYTL
ncbi:hypothetical protein BC629DRAFT_1601169 [Irpex lacteus]|nr:hypothetical protein BC629DRAFT_1601169 [Irpex lacteus]